MSHQSYFSFYKKIPHVHLDDVIKRKPWKTQATFHIKNTKMRRVQNFCFFNSMTDQCAKKCTTGNKYFFEKVYTPNWNSVEMTMLSPSIWFGRVFFFWKKNYFITFSSTHNIIWECDFQNLEINFNNIKSPKT